jgi:ubiquinone/menaquinone biosynthesis C-methylase UbiE
MKILRTLRRFFFHHFYHSLSWTYDFVAAIVSLGHWNEWGRSSAQFIEGHNILELGFGTGYLQADLLQKNYLAFGLDESPQMVRRTSNRLQKLGLTPNLVRGFAQALPYPEHFDTIIATFPSEYIFAPQSLAEANRILKPGGLMVILLSVWHGDRTLLERSASWLFQVTGQRVSDPEEFERRIENSFSGTNFVVDIKIQKNKSSTLLFVLARKPEKL